MNDGELWSRDLVYDIEWEMKSLKPSIHSFECRCESGEWWDLGGNGGVSGHSGSCGSGESGEWYMWECEVGWSEGGGREDGEGTNLLRDAEAKQEKRMLGRHFTPRVFSWGRVRTYATTVQFTPTPLGANEGVLYKHAPVNNPYPNMAAIKSTATGLSEEQQTLVRKMR